MKTDKQEIIKKAIISSDILIKLEAEKLELLKMHKKGLQQMLDEKINKLNENK